jgi:hypothetical protein
MVNKIRKFKTGATRDIDSGKIDPEGYISPIVIKRFAEYMLKHQYQSDGKVRQSDNWQKGIGQEIYMKSLWRHFLDLWLLHRKEDGSREDIENACCAIMFNVMGFLFEELRKKK